MVARSVGFSVGRPVGIPVTGDGVSAGSFSPLDITSLELWLDADDSDTVLTSISPDVSATNGQNVRRWLDKSGNDRHANQTVADDQPEYQTSAVNSRNGLFCDGVSEGMLASIDNTVSAGTVLFVMDLDADAFAIPVGNRAGSSYPVISQDANTVSALAVKSGSPSYRLNGELQGFRTRDQVHYVMSAKKFLLEISNIDFTAGGYSDGLLAISYYDNANFYCTGHVCELFMFSTGLSASHRSSLNTYLDDKWSLDLGTVPFTLDLLTWTL